jgi:hypothetical protein
MYSDSTVAVTFFVMLAVIILVFILLREFNCWYWKINERIRLQKEMIELLKGILDKQEARSTDSPDES